MICSDASKSTNDPLVAFSLLLNCCSAASPPLIRLLLHQSILQSFSINGSPSGSAAAEIHRNVEYKRNDCSILEHF